MRARSIATLSFFVLLAGCDDAPGGPEDGGTSGMDAGLDASVGVECAGAADGTACGSELICLAGACGLSRCGDGYVDAAREEECDDGNGVAFDGCEPGSCTLTCRADADCDDGAACNGAETCAGTPAVCVAGAPPADGSACTRPGMDDGVCRARLCVGAGCGNGVVEDEEACDDGNEVPGDGCEPDCTYTCETDADCNDEDVCNGEETCDVAAHTCVPGTALDCDDGSPCTMNLCSPSEGCSNPLIDEDGDGHAPMSLGPCGTDCNDANPSVYVGAPELCDGIDNNCNGMTDETAPTWYVDCDADGYAASTDGARVGCDAPPASATGCGGGWTARRPVDMASTDCHDNNRNVHPGQVLYFESPYTRIGGGSSYDYNCDGVDTRRFGCTPSDGSCGTRCDGGFMPRTDTNPNGCTYVCIGGTCSRSTPPACGVTASYKSCAALSGGGCIQSIPANRRQSCR
ncbi:MAG: hypothetical protein KF729_08200 [Sandaracinaceae bacterium]|nr:hypothetical protein [Sandaracinaceae bacterium]